MHILWNILLSGLTLGIGTEALKTENVTFDSQGLRLSAYLYIPENVTEGTLMPAIAVSHPASGVKEQTAGVYARMLAEKGFITLVWDAAYGGESEGQPRGLEDPAHRIEDIKNGISFLTLDRRVDPKRIGLFGVCASGGYSTVAAATDLRIRALATVSGTDVGLFFRQGYNGKQDPSVLHTMLENAARARTDAAAGREMAGFDIFPPNETAARAQGQYVYEGWRYYMTPQGFNARSTKVLPWNSVDKIAGFDGFGFIHAIAPRPVLLMVGTRADTKWMAENAIKNAGEPKELFWIQNATHNDLYWDQKYMTQAVNRGSDYFHKYLSA